MFETREWCDSRSKTLGHVLGRRHFMSIASAHALMRARSGTALGKAEATLTEPMLRTVLPVRWAVEVAVALEAGGEPQAASVILGMFGSVKRYWLDEFAESPVSTTAHAARALSEQVLVPPEATLSLTLFGRVALASNGIPSTWRGRIRHWCFSPSLRFIR